MSEGVFSFCKYLLSTYYVPHTTLRLWGYSREENEDSVVELILAMELTQQEERQAPCFSS